MPLRFHHFPLHLLLCLLLITFYAFQGECKDWHESGTIGAKGKTNVTASGSTAVQDSHVFLEVNITQKGSSPNCSHPLLLQATTSINNQTRTLWSFSWSNDTGINHSFFESPCQEHLNNGTLLELSAILECPSNHTTYDASLTLTSEPTRLGWGSRHYDKTTFCPGYRYFYVDVPDDGYGHNITITSTTHIILTVFSAAYFRWDDCPDVSGGLYDQELSNLSSLPRESGHTLELRRGGRYWIALECIGTYAAKNWELTFNDKKTCLLGCLERGYCNPHAPSPYCVCGYFHTGDDCSKLYPGDFALMAVALLALIVAVVYISYRIIKWRGSKKMKERFSMAEKEPLLKEETDYDVDGEIYVHS